MRVLYFAWVKEKAGIAAEEIDPPKGVTTSTMLSPGLSVPTRCTIRLACNGQREWASASMLSLIHI